MTFDNNNILNINTIFKKILFHSMSFYLRTFRDFHIASHGAVLFLLGWAWISIVLLYKCAIVFMRRDPSLPPSKKKKTKSLVENTDDEGAREQDADGSGRVAQHREMGRGCVCVRVCVCVVCRHGRRGGGGGCSHLLSGCGACRTRESY